MLTNAELLTLVITLVAFLAILSNRLRADIIAILVLLAVGFSGLVTPQEALSGFSSSVVIVIFGLFVITNALEETGIVQWIARRLYKISGSAETRLIALFMGLGALLSLVMNNIAAGAVILPAAVRVGNISKVRLSKLLIPVSFGTMVGGMATYLTTANIILSGILEAQGLEGLGMLDFIPTGGLIVLTTLAYMVSIGRHLLPDREGMGQVVPVPDLYETYQLAERMWEVRVERGSPLCGISLANSRIGAELGLTVLAIWRGRTAILAPNPDQVIEPEDYLLVMGRHERLEQLLQWGVSSRGAYGTDPKHHFQVNLSEVVIPPRSRVVGKSLTELQHRNQFGLTAVALWREGRSYRTDVGKFALEVGDALLMVGPEDGVKKLAAHRDYLVLNRDNGYQPLERKKAAWALGITIAVIILAIFDIFPLSLLMLAGAMGMILSGCISVDDAYHDTEWRVIFLIAGMLPLSIALVKSGLAERVGTLLVMTLSNSGPLALIAGLFMLAMAITQIISSQVTALVIGPIAINAALQLGIDAQAVAVAVAIGCSTSFLTPVAHPVNILMMGPAGYRAGDFFRVGIGMTVVTFVTLLIAMFLFWGIR